MTFFILMCDAGVAVGAGGLSGYSLERFGEMVNVGEPALGGVLASRKARVLEKVLSALNPRVQQEPVGWSSETVVEHPREVGR